MSQIAEEILRAERDHVLGVRLLEPEDRNQLRLRVFARYGARSHRLWESALDCASIQDKDGWQAIADFVGMRSCVLLFDLEDEVEMFRVPSGSSLDELLGHTFGFVFYVTDVNANYLICFNDHDFLICCGSALEWLKGRQ